LYTALCRQTQQLCSCSCCVQLSWMSDFKLLKIHMNTLSQRPIHTVPKHLTGFPVKVKTFASLFREYTPRKELNSHHMSGGSYNTQLARGTRSAQLAWDKTISALQGTYQRKQDFPCTFQIKQCTQTHCYILNTKLPLVQTEHLEKQICKLSLWCWWVH